MKQLLFHQTHEGAGHLDSYPDEGLLEASEKMLRHNVRRLPVVDQDEKNVAGYLGRPGIMAARLHRFNDGYVREAGWFKGFTKEPAET